MDLLIFGCGYSASRFLALHGDRFSSVVATVRDVAAAPSDLADVLAFDGRRWTEALAAAVRAATHILVSIPPDEEGDPVLRVFAREIVAAPRLAWIGYLSTVGVYGDFDGAWVDETTPIRPTAERNRRRAGVEQDWIALGSRRCDVQVFRLSGIYGPRQNALENIRRGSARRIVKPGQVFNRIHVDDIAGAVLAGIGRPGVGPIVNVTDDEPAPNPDVVAYAAGLIGCAPPPEMAFEEAALTPMARSFYEENKRVSNARLREELGYRLLYPTYREGLRALLDE